jgi:2-polyprenyl-3-methyl-5-hydroxy-6-metoxy-1,4-benzoquinol methylase
MNRYEVARLKRIASVCRGQTVLDIGYAQMPNRHFKGMEVTGVDLGKPTSPSGYREEIEADAMDLGSVLHDRRFDNIVAGEFIEHVERPYDFLRSLSPLLADNGQLILSTPNPVAFPTLWFEWIRSRRFYYTDQHTFYFLPRWVVRLLERSGYRVTSILPVGLWTPLGPLPSPIALSYQVIYVATPGS